MRTRSLLCALLAAPWLAGHASEVARQHVAQIDCGGTTFNLATRFDQNTASGLGIISQKLSYGPNRTLNLRAFSLGKSRGLLRADITGWVCVTGTRQKILVLGYSCASDAGDGCGGAKEWLRLVSAQGVVLDAQFRPEDDREPALLHKLGIARPLQDGVSLQEVLE